ncbi:MAG: hypothetical protein CM15mP22_7710 [Gammaproteobacteria bacterium]|nr:MAG: hypothetical protein CM15mP22_7710 [Gammaproteobacteria bacterium]
MRGRSCSNFYCYGLQNSIDVVYVGVLPNLFKENSGVVASGYLTEGNAFWAVEILAKHDENICQ